MAPLPKLKYKALSASLTSLPWETGAVHTSKCSLDGANNKDMFRRCVKCARSYCSPCFYRRGFAHICQTDPAHGQPPFPSFEQEKAVLAFFGAKIPPGWQCDREGHEGAWIWKPGKAAREEALRRGIVLVVGEDGSAQIPGLVDRGGGEWSEAAVHHDVEAGSSTSVDPFSAEAKRITNAAATAAAAAAPANVPSKMVSSGFVAINRPQQTDEMLDQTSSVYQDHACSSDHNSQRPAKLSPTLRRLHLKRAASRTFSSTRHRLVANKKLTPRSTPNTMAEPSSAQTAEPSSSQTASGDSSPPNQRASPASRVTKTKRKVASKASSSVAGPSNQVSAGTAERPPKSKATRKKHIVAEDDPSSDDAMDVDGVDALAPSTAKQSEAISPSGSDASVTLDGESEGEAVLEWDSENLCEYDPQSEAYKDEDDELYAEIPADFYGPVTRSGSPFRPSRRILKTLLDKSEDDTLSQLPPQEGSSPDRPSRRSQAVPKEKKFFELGKQAWKPSLTETQTNDERIAENRTFALDVRHIDYLQLTLQPGFHLLGPDSAPVASSAYLSRVAAPPAALYYQHRNSTRCNRLERTAVAFLTVPGGAPAPVVQGSSGPDWMYTGPTMGEDLHRAFQRATTGEMLPGETGPSQERRVG